MDRLYWHKQTTEKPLFPDLLWSRPENRSQAGKLGIVGGNAHGFSAAAEAYATSDKAGVGVARVLLPDSLQKTVGRVFEAGEYAPSTPSGSFSQKALSDALDLALWSDGLLIAGDLGRNSETAILIEAVQRNYHGQLTFTKDAVDYVIAAPELLLKRPESLLVLSFAQLQKLGTTSHFSKAFTFDMDLLRLIDNLHEFTMIHDSAIVVKHLQNIIVAVKGQVSTTKLEADKPVWRVATAASAAVGWLQNPSKPFESLSTSLIA